jgi:hypothetical protein
VQGDVDQRSLGFQTTAPAVIQRNMRICDVRKREGFPHRWVADALAYGVENVMNVRTVFL